MTNAVSINSNNIKHHILKHFVDVSYNYGQMMFWLLYCHNSDQSYGKSLAILWTKCYPTQV